MGIAILKEFLAQNLSKELYDIAMRLIDVAVAEEIELSRDA